MCGKVFSGTFRSVSVWILAALLYPCFTSRTSGRIRIKFGVVLERWHPSAKVVTGYRIVDLIRFPAGARFFGTGPVSRPALKRILSYLHPFPGVLILGIKRSESDADRRD